MLFKSILLINIQLSRIGIVTQKKRIKAIIF